MQIAPQPRRAAWCFFAIVRIGQWLARLFRPSAPTLDTTSRYTTLYARRASQELATARTLLAQRQFRAAGAIAGVALEFHLHHVAAVHAIGVGQNATIGQLQNALRFAGVLHPRQRKVIQRLSDLRNRCVHAREHVPDRPMVTKLVEGTAQLMETLR
jgi:hypothetical protein